jgi:hypothetical protein
MLLMIDNYDSFTFNLVQYLQMLGAEVKVVRNDAMSVDQIAAHRTSDSDLSNKHNRIVSAWSSHSSEPLASLNNKQDMDSTRNLVGDKQQRNFYNRLHPNVFSYQQQSAGGTSSIVGDSFGRRASMSQLPFYSGVWDQVWN